MTWIVIAAVVSGDPIPAAWGNNINNNINDSAVNKVTAAGSIVYATGAKAVTELVAGSVNDVLQMFGGLPSWTKITDLNVNAANKDGTAATASLRTLGGAATQAAAGNHNHSHNSLSTIGTDDHHAKSHLHNGADGSGSVAHTALTSIDTDTSGSAIHHTLGSGAFQAAGGTHVHPLPAWGQSSLTGADLALTGAYQTVGSAAFAAPSDGVLAIQAHINAQTTVSGAQPRMRIRVTDGVGADTQSAEAIFMVSPGANWQAIAPMAVVLAMQVVSGRTYTIIVEAFNNGAAGSTVFRNTAPGSISYQMDR